MALDDRYKLGIPARGDAREAILNGDYSGRHIHPIYIDLAHLYGCRLSGRRIFDNDQKALDAKYKNQLIATLRNLKMDCGLFNYANIHLIVGMYFFMTSEMVRAMDSIKKAAIAIGHYNPSPTGPVPRGSLASGYLEFQADVQEPFTPMAHIVIFRSLLQIHLLEKKNRQIKVSVLGKISVCILPIAGPYLMLSCAYHGSQEHYTEMVLKVLMDPDVGGERWLEHCKRFEDNLRVRLHFLFSGQLLVLNLV